MKEHGTPTARLYVLIGVMVLSWALSFVVGKLVLREIPPLLIGGARTTLAGLCLAVLYAVRRKTQPRIDREHWGTLASIAICGVALNQLLFIVGLSRTSVGHSAVVIALSPILVLLFASAIGQEQVTARKLAGMVVALAGVATLQFGHSGDARGATFTGDFITLLGACSFAIYSVLSKRIATRYGGITVNALAYTAGALLLAPVTYWQAETTELSSISAGAWLGVIYMAVFPSVVCYLIFYYALTYISASKLAAFSYLQPLLATLIAIPVLGERPTTELAAGGALVLAGVWIAERS